MAFSVAPMLDKTTHIARKDAHLPHFILLLLETLVAHTSDLDLSRRTGYCRILSGLLYVPQYRAASVYGLVCRGRSVVIAGWSYLVPVRCASCANSLSIHAAC